MSDPINSPAHYTQGNIEVIDFIEDKKLGFHEGNVCKYVARAKHKGNELEDLKKAAWYLNRAIENIELREGLSPMRGVHARIEFVDDRVHLEDATTFNGTRCNLKPGIGGVAQHEHHVTCEACRTTLRPPHPSEVRTVHIVRPPHEQCLCGHFGKDTATTADPEAATCIKWKVDRLLIEAKASGISAA